MLELFDVANNIGKDEYRVGSITSHVTQQKRAEVAAQINSIEAEENRNTDAVEKFEAKLREHWATYAAFHCRAFCDYIRQRLPRELRMIVFEALWKDAQHTITDWNLQALATKPVNPVALVESWSGRDTRHCFDERFVGPDLQHEILDPWWRMSVFNFKTSRLIPHFLNEDFWGAIVKDQIRNVVVSLSYREWMSGPMTGTRWLKSQIKTTVSGADIDSELDYLGNLSPTSRIALSIKKRDFRHYIRSTVQQRQNAFLAALSHLFVGLAKLRSDGYHVCVLVDNDIEIKIDHADISMEGWRKQLDNAVDVSSFRIKNDY